MDTTTSGTPFAVAVVAAACALCYAVATDCENTRLRRKLDATRPAREAYQAGRVDGLADGVRIGTAAARRPPAPAPAR